MRQVLTLTIAKMLSGFHYDETQRTLSYSSAICCQFGLWAGFIGDDAMNGVTAGIFRYGVDIIPCDLFNGLKGICVLADRVIFDGVHCIVLFCDPDIVLNAWEGGNCGKKGYKI